MGVPQARIPAPDRKPSPSESMNETVHCRRAAQSLLALHGSLSHARVPTRRWSFRCTWRWHHIRALRRMNELDQVARRAGSCPPIRAFASHRATSHCPGWVAARRARGRTVLRALTLCVAGVLPGVPAFGMSRRGKTKGERIAASRPLRVRTLLFR